MDHFNTSSTGARLRTGLFTALAVSLFLSLFPSPHTVSAQPHNQPQHAPADPHVLAVIRRIKAASQSMKSVTADFTYSVSSVKQQQMVCGSAKLMKPNLARYTFSYMTTPAFPNIIASDGKTVYSFTPTSFQPDRTFKPASEAAPFDPLMGAKYASGLEEGGGTITNHPAEPDGHNLNLWDAAPLLAFFDPDYTLQRWLYVNDLAELRYEGEKKVNGITYSVLGHHVAGGNIATKETTDFDQSLYVGQDGIIYLYILEFKSGGRPGIQITRLTNIKINAPLAETDFAFMPPDAPAK